MTEYDSYLVTELTLDGLSYFVTSETSIEDGNPVDIYKWISYLHDMEYKHGFNKPKFRKLLQ